MDNERDKLISLAFEHTLITIRVSQKLKTGAEIDPKDPKKIREQRAYYEKCKLADPSLPESLIDLAIQNVSI